MASLIDFRLLGPIEVTANGEPLALGAAKQRALLAVLLLNVNEFVSRDRLIDALWGERASSGAAHSLQVYVSGLRKLLAAHGGRELLVTSPGGYLIKLEPGQLDLARFRALVEEGRLALATGSSAVAAAKLSEALALWRGEPLADLQFEPFARAAIARLEELRTAAVEDRMDADLRAGRASELLPELEALIGRHPLRERLRRQLMLALYRAGRQAEALQVYRETRRLLIDELGIEPGTELKELEQAILSHDPALDRSALEEAATEPVKSAASRERSWLRSRLLLSALVPVLGGVGVALFFLLHGAPPGLARVDPNAVGIVDPGSGRIVAEVRAGSTPTQAAYGAGSLWVASTGSNSVLRIDSKANTPRDTIEVGHSPGGIAFGYGAAWVANSLDGTLARIDAGTGTVVQTIPVGSNPSAVAVGSGAVWVANTDDRTVMRLDARTGEVVFTSRVGIRARSIAVAGGGVWITNDAGANVLRLDGKTGAVTDTVGVGNGPTALAFGAGSLWVANDIDGTVSRIDPTSKRVTATVAVGNGSGEIAFARGHVWVSSEFSGTLVEIDPRSNRPLRSLSVAERPTAIVAADDRLWVLAGASGSEHRGGTLTVSEVVPFDSVDPALAYTPAAWSLLIMTNDGLTGFKRVGGAEGGRLVPDLGVSLPAPTEGGRAYRFQLRPDLHYSTGAPVRPADFRRALERVFALGSPGSGYYRNIVGAIGCEKQPKRCDLSRGIVVDAAANSLTFHLVAPDPEFLYKLALPFAYAVPAETTLRVATRPLPATGPYVAVAYQPGSHYELERNPHFREWSRAAQPDGYPDKIVVRLQDHTSGADVTRVLRGETDLLKGNVPVERLGELATRYPGRLHLDPLHQTIYVFMNAHLAPFDDVRVRRAVNFAFDRALFARLIAGQLAQPTCQILPPNFAGYVPYCPYTSRPSPDGRWSGPDLGEARRLVAASGTKGERIVVWIQPGFSESGARYLEGLLRRLGYRASLEFVSSDTYHRTVSDPSTKVQMGGLDGWNADLPVASNFVEPTFRCAVTRPSGPFTPNLAKFCDAAIDAEMDKAKEVEATDPFAGDRLWTQIEHELVDRAPWLPVVTALEPNLVSARVGNYEYSPQWRVLIDQLWVR